MKKLKTMLFPTPPGCTDAENDEMVRVFLILAGGGILFLGSGALLAWMGVL